MNISICTFDNFNELDSLIAFSILSKLKKYDQSVNVYIASNKKKITSMNGVSIESTRDISKIIEDDIIIFGSSSNTEILVKDEELIENISKSINVDKQIICSQCSGALFLEKLDLIRGGVSTDSKTAQKLKSRGYIVHDRPFNINGNIVSSGGCLSSIYLSIFLINKYFDINIEDLFKEIVHDKEINITLDNIFKVIS